MANSCQSGRARRALRALLCSWGGLVWMLCTGRVQEEQGNTCSQNVWGLCPNSLELEWRSVNPLCPFIPEIACCPDRTTVQYSARIASYWLKCIPVEIDRFHMELLYTGAPKSPRKADFPSWVPQAQDNCAHITYVVFKWNLWSPWCFTVLLPQCLQ